MTNRSVQFVYVLTNPAMPGLVKIGKTTQSEIKERMKQLYGTGVPFPFDCAFACQVKDAAAVEKALHHAFGMTQINPNREFFKIEPERIISVLQLLKVCDITQQFEQTIELDVPSTDKQSARAFKRSMRPQMNFHELAIPTGSVLHSKDNKYQCTIVSDRKVEYNGNICSLTAATRQILGLADNYPLQPSPYWIFNGKTVKEIYENYHGDSTEN